LVEWQVKASRLHNALNARVELLGFGGEQLRHPFGDICDLSPAAKERDADHKFFGFQPPFGIRSLPDCSRKWCGRKEKRDSSKEQLLHSGER